MTQPPAIPAELDRRNPLIRYDTACRAIAEAKSVDEAKNIRDKAEAMRAYARQAKNRTLEIDAAEIRIRAERRVGEMMAAQRETVGLNTGGRPEKTGSASDPVTDVPTLAAAGIDKHLADRARKMAAVPEAQFNGMLAGWRERIADENERVTTDLLKAGAAHVRGTFGTGENEWYTPPEYLAAARLVLGDFDLDPASSAEAQQLVQAKAYFSESDNGLAQEWIGRVWLNPPYAQPLIAEFVGKLVSEFSAKRVVAAILLTHNYTDTAWFHEAASACAAVCFTRGRVKFIDAKGNVAAPTQGQAFFYYGNEVDTFAARFVEFGFVVRPI